MMPTTSSEPSRLASRAASPPPPDYYQGEGSSIMSQEQPHFHVRDGRDGLEDDSSLVHKARLATEAEQSMRLSDAIKTYPKAVAWSLLLSSAIVMEGFDIVLMGSFYAFPQFQRKYGDQQPDGSWIIPASWQSALSNGAQGGEIIGLFVSGIVSERFGYRKTMIGALLLITCAIFIPFFAPNIKVLVVGQVLMGLPWGCFQTLAPAYASEVCPTVLRAYLSTANNLAWVMGQLLASGVLRSLLSNQTEWAYRLPFALQWMWPVPILIACFFAPESPWWLVRHSRPDEARSSLRRLRSSRAPPEQVEQTLAMIAHTNAMERAVSEGTRYLDCFKGTNLRRTEIVCIVWAIQALCGSAFMGFSTFFYERAGLSTDHAFDMSMAQYGLGVIGTLISWILLLRCGRRTLYVAGLAILAVLLLVIGTIGAVGGNAQGASWAVGSCLLLYTIIYDSTVGPVCYTLVAEIPSSRLRPKSIVLARNLFNVCEIFNYQIVPLQLGTDAWNWRAKTGFFWAGVCALCLVWSYFRLPEPKGRTYGELDLLFEQKVPARAFSRTVVDQFSEATPTAPEPTTKAKEDSNIEYEEVVRRQS